MIRSWMKTGAARVMNRTGVCNLFGSWSGARGVPLVINYHRVVEDFAASARTSIPSMLVSRSMLEQHLDWIGDLAAAAEAQGVPPFYRDLLSLTARFVACEASAVPA